MVNEIETVNIITQSDLLDNIHSVDRPFIVSKSQLFLDRLIGGRLFTGYIEGGDFLWFPPGWMHRDAQSFDKPPYRFLKIGGGSLQSNSPQK